MLINPNWVATDFAACNEPAQPVGSLLAAGPFRAFSFALLVKLRSVDSVEPDPNLANG
jgi:hypothetical protein